MNSLEVVYELLSEKLENTKKGQIENINFSINLYSSLINEIKELLKEKFQSVNPEDVNQIKDIAQKFISLLPQDSEIVKVEDMAMHIYNLCNFFDESYNQVEKAKDVVSSVISVYQKILSDLYRQKKNIISSNESNLIEKILVCFKKDENKYYSLVCDFSLEEYNSIINLIDKLDLDIEVKNDFVESINISLARTKEIKEKITSKEVKLVENLRSIVDIDSTDEQINQELDNLENLDNTDDKILKNFHLPARSKKINTLINKLETLELIFDTSRIPIDSNTPINQNRTKYYSDDLSIVLYDLQNYIGPDIINEKYNNNIPQDVIDNLSKIYRYILNRYRYLLEKPQNNIIPDENVEIIEISETTEPIETINNQVDTVTPSVEEVVEELPVEPVVYTLSPEAIMGINLTEDDVKLVKKCNEIVEKYWDQLSRISRTEMEQYCASNITKILDYDETETALIKMLFNFPDKYKNYKESCDFLLNRNDNEFSSLLEKEEYYTLVEKEKDSLLIDIRSIIDLNDELELLSETDIVRDNLILILDHDDFDEQIEEIFRKSDKKIKSNLVQQTFELLEQSNIAMNDDSIKSLKPLSTASKSLQKEYVDNNPYRKRVSDLRLCYITISVSEKNKAEIMEEFNISSSNSRMFLALMVFYKRGNDKIYDEVFKKFIKIKGTDENDEYTIEWVKGIFKKDFTPETRKIAFDLIRNSIKYIRSINKEHLIQLDGERTEEPNMGQGGYPHGA